jgi:hypothetical protein
MCKIKMTNTYLVKPYLASVKMGFLAVKILPKNISTTHKKGGFFGIRIINLAPQRQYPLEEILASHYSHNATIPTY